MAKAGQYNIKYTVDRDDRKKIFELLYAIMAVVETDVTAGVGTDDYIVYLKRERVKASAQDMRRLIAVSWNPLATNTAFERSFGFRQFLAKEMKSRRRNMKHRRRKVMLGILAMIGILFFCGAGCDLAPPAVEEVLKEYFQKHPSTPEEDAKKSHTLSRNYSQLLDNRVLVRMPEGSQPYQLEADLSAQPPDASADFIDFSRMTWAKDNELFYISAYETFLASCGDILQDTQNILAIDGMHGYTVQLATADASCPVAVLIPNDWKTQQAYGNDPILKGYMIGADNTLIRVCLNLYTLDPTRLELYRKLGREIFATLLPGERQLQTQGVTGTLQGVTIQLLPGYTYNYYGNQDVVNSRQYGTKWTKAHIYLVIKIAEYDKIYRIMRIEFGRNLRVQPPDNTQTILAPIDDVILGKPVQWQQLQNGSNLFLETVVPLKGNRTMRIQIGSEDKAVLREMLEMARTLRKIE